MTDHTKHERPCVAVGSSFRGTPAGEAINEMKMLPGRTITLTLRDYFIAHAPAEPQPWFEPVMPDCPERPPKPEGFSEPQRVQLDDFFWEGIDPEDPAVIDYVRQYKGAQREAEHWREERNRQRYLQWPAAWADAMLEMRSRGGDG